MNVLFVCTGNTCRSPMAEAIARSFAGGSAVVFASAGLHAEDGASATPDAVETATAFGGDAGHHWSRQIDGERVAWADRIYVMTAEHLHGVRSRFPDAVEKAGMLDPAGADVADPYGAGIASYLSAAGHIAMAIEARAEEWQVG